MKAASAKAQAEAKEAQAQVESYKEVAASMQGRVCVREGPAQVASSSSVLGLEMADCERSLEAARAEATELAELLASSRAEKEAGLQEAALLREQKDKGEAAARKLKALLLKARGELAEARAETEAARGDLVAKDASLADLTAQLDQLKVPPALLLLPVYNGRCREGGHVVERVGAGDAGGGVGVHGGLPAAAAGHHVRRQGGGSKRACCPAPGAPLLQGF